jgi:hypothetical protein
LAYDLLQNTLQPNPNYLINSGFIVAQKATSATITAGTATPTASLGYPVFDCWFAYSVGGNPTLAQIAGTTTTANRLQLTGAASITSVGIGQRIEAINTIPLALKVVTLSFECSNSLLTSLTVTANRPTTVDAFGTIGTPTKTLINSSVVTINSTLTRYSVTFTCPQEVDKGLEIVFTLGAQTSGTFVLSNVKLEEGAVATPFTTIDYGSDLVKCQRYFRKMSDYLYVYFVNVGTLSSEQLHLNMFGTTRIRNLTAANAISGSSVSIGSGVTEDSTRASYKSLGAGYYGGVPVYTVSAYIP